MTFKVLKTWELLCKTVELNHAQNPYQNHAPPLAKAGIKVGNLIIAI